MEAGNNHLTKYRTLINTRQGKPQQGHAHIHRTGHPKWDTRGNVPECRNERRRDRNESTACHEQSAPDAAVFRGQTSRCIPKSKLALTNRNDRFKGVLRINNSIHCVKPEVDHTREPNILRLRAHLREEPSEYSTDTACYK